MKYPVKYITLGEMRSGTTVIHESLEQDKQLKVAYEIFNCLSCSKISNISNLETLLMSLYKKPTLSVEQYKSDHISNKLYPYKEKFISETDLIKFVDCVYNNFNGFKILYHQISKQNNIWQYLIDQKIKIIHVIRNNYLDILYSQVQAHLTDIWNISKCKPNDYAKSIYISPSTAEKFFDYMDYQIYYFKQLFKDNVLYVNYEDVYDIKTFNKIQSFLETDYCKIDYKCVKLNKVKNIQNISELKSYFKNTNRYVFFKEKFY